MGGFEVKKEEKIRLSRIKVNIGVELYKIIKLLTFWKDSDFIWFLYKKIRLLTYLYRNINISNKNNSILIMYHIRLKMLLHENLFKISSQCILVFN